MKNVLMLLFVMTMMSAWSCEQSPSEKKQAELDSQIEKHLEFADSTGTGEKARENLLAILKKNSEEAKASEKDALEEIASELTKEELNEVHALAKKLKSDREAEVAEAKKKAAEAKAAADKAKQQLAVNDKTD
jgi:hypothetical protein